MGKVNIFGVESGKKEYSLDTRGKFILSIAYVRKHSILLSFGFLTFTLALGHHLCPDLAGMLATG